MKTTHTNVTPATFRYNTIWELCLVVTHDVARFIISLDAVLGEGNSCVCVRRGYGIGGWSDTRLGQN